ncbi:MAG: peptidase S8, partial [Bacteroidota bacterium]
MKTPAYRYLRGYTIDPGFSTVLDTYKVNETVYRINWEAVKPGPSGEYLEVVDVDPASGCFYRPINLNDPIVMVNQGLIPSEGNPQFHQQFVFTIGMLTIENFEKALGRKVIWRPPIGKEDNEKKTLWPLRIYPHAIRQANAYYSPAKKSILFGYFRAGENTEGTNFPGGTVFTCLSPDIIAHEMTHAILDSIHPRFRENTNPDVAAFHEGFADTVALLQRFSTIDLIEHEL